jgi:hypothetical protein
MDSGRISVVVVKCGEGKVSKKGLGKFTLSKKRECGGEVEGEGEGMRL